MALVYASAVVGDATAPRVKLADRLAPATTSTHLKVYPLKVQPLPRRRPVAMPLRVTHTNLPPIH